MAVLSLICSSILVRHLVLSRQLNKVANRVFLGVTCSDMLYTFAAPFLSTWMVPRNVVDANGATVDIYGNVGTPLTCSLQGFFDQLASKSSWFYNAELAVVYLILMRFRTGEKRLVQYEYILHAIPISLGLTAAILPLPYQNYNATGGWLCWIAESPLGCSDNANVDCDRGDHWPMLRLWTAYIPLFVTQSMVAICMFLVYCTVYARERVGTRYAASTHRNQARRVALRCTLYVLAFEMTWFFALYVAVRDFVIAGTDSEKELAADEDPFLYLSLILLPTYGIWSSIAYFALPFIKNRKDHSDWSLCKVLQYTVWERPEMEPSSHRLSSIATRPPQRASDRLSSASTTTRPPSDESERGEAQVVVNALPQRSQLCNKLTTS